MKKLSKSLLIFLLATLVFSLFSCKEEEKVDVWSSAIYTEDTTLGEGEKTVCVEVRAGEKKITFTINTDAENLADALLEHSLIEGDTTQYGLYIKSVNNILADFNQGGYYWALYKSGEYLMTSADTTLISDGEHFEIVRTK